MPLFVWDPNVRAKVRFPLAQAQTFAAGIIIGAPGIGEQFRFQGSFRKNHQEAVMLGWAITFLIVAIIAAILGFGGIAGTAIEIAKIIFFVAIVLFAISAIVGLLRGRSPTVP